MKVNPELPIRDKENKRKDEKVRLNDHEKVVVRQNANKFDMEFGVYLREVAYNPQKFSEHDQGKTVSLAPLPKGKSVNRVTFKDKIIKINHETDDCVGTADKVNLYEDDRTIRIEAHEFVLTYTRKDTLMKEKGRR